MEPTSILVIDDNKGLLEVWSFILEDRHYEVDTAVTGSEALKKLHSRPYNIALVDVHLPDARGTDLLSDVKRIRPDTDCVMITAHSSMESALEAMNRGAYSYLVKPVDPAELLATIDRILERQLLREENRRMMAEIQSSNHILQTLINSVDSGIMLVGSGGEIRFANRRVGELLNLDGVTLAGCDQPTIFRDLVSPRAADPQALMESLTSSVATSASGVEMEWELLQPSRRVLRRYCVPIQGHNGGVLGRVEVYSDITRQKALLDREHQIAETLQRSILPDVPEAVEGLEVATLYRAALEEARVGGDFYDVFSVGSGRIAVVIGDVSGKGLGAAVQTAMARYALRSYAFEDPRPAAVLERLNRLAYAQTGAESFVTLFYALFDLDAGRLSYSSAGHEAPLLWHAGTGEILMLGDGGPVLGAMPRAHYGQDEVPWLPGSILLLYTDGLTEARRDGVFLDIEGARALFARHARSDSARTIIDGIYQDLKQYSEDSFRDDIALLVVRLPVPASAPGASGDAAPET